MKKRLLSIYDLTGNWSQPYEEAGWEVWRIDLQRGFNIYDWNYKALSNDFFRGILIAQPCTDFSLSGAKHFKEKDSNGTTYESMSMVYKSLAIVEYFRPGLEFWTMENPMSRIHKLIPELGTVKLKFDPFEFAGYDPVPENSQYQKQTWLWGDFKTPEKKEMENINGQKLFKNLGGKSLKTKNERSKTPLGFAYAFFKSNQ